LGDYQSFIIQLNGSYSFYFQNGQHYKEQLASHFWDDLTIKFRTH